MVFICLELGAIVWLFHSGYDAIGGVAILLVALPFVSQALFFTNSVSVKRLPGLVASPPRPSPATLAQTNRLGAAGFVVSFYTELNAAASQTKPVGESGFGGDPCLAMTPAAWSQIERAFSVRSDQSFACEIAIRRAGRSRAFGSPASDISSAARHVSVVDGAITWYETSNGIRLELSSEDASWRISGLAGGPFGQA